MSFKTKIILRISAIVTEEINRLDRVHSVSVNTGECVFTTHRSYRVCVPTARPCIPLGSFSRAFCDVGCCRALTVGLYRLPSSIV